MLFALSVAVGISAAVAVGGGVGWVVAQSVVSGCDPGRKFCDIEAVLFGALAALGVGTIAYLVAGVATIRCCRPEGDRQNFVAGLLLMLVLAVPLLFGGLLLLG